MALQETLFAVTDKIWRELRRGGGVTALFCRTGAKCTRAKSTTHWKAKWMRKGWCFFANQQPRQINRPSVSKDLSSLRGPEMCVTHQCTFFRCNFDDLRAQKHRGICSSHTYAFVGGPRENWEANWCAGRVWLCILLYPWTQWVDSSEMYLSAKSGESTVDVWTG